MLENSTKQSENDESARLCVNQMRNRARNSLNV